MPGVEFSLTFSPNLSPNWFGKEIMFIPEYLTPYVDSFGKFRISR